GNRIEMKQRKSVIRYVVDESSPLSRMLMEVNEDGEAFAWYVYGLGLIGREDADGQYLSYHSDLRGSTTILTNEASQVTDRYTYGLYGELTSHEGSTNQPFRYNGRDGVQTDPNGLYYMRARYYDPKLKRFLNRDVIQGTITDGQTFNRYAYVNGDPVSYVDPLGLSKDFAGCKKGLQNSAEASTHVADSSQTEKFYRTMSEKEFKKLEKNNILTKRTSGQSELKITDDPNYSKSDLSKRKSQNSRKYTHVVEFDVTTGTKDKLLSIGGVQEPNRRQAQKTLESYADYKTGMVEIKLEKSNNTNEPVISLGLGFSKQGLEIFNENIIRWRQI
ncbi:RHS repeat-associated core domain-containing protein, partial [Paenibacillus kandeliae]|uniref:RHS repeat-associated core domain-containing protein n=1 Tax=Paenibacillus kandeliae TaxID=3231269 RepID=UPI0034577F9B